MLGVGARVGCYRVIDSHPNGGYRAVDLDQRRRVVLELRAGQDGQESVAQHLRAASIISAIRHPGMARIVDHGELPDRTPWSATELAYGLALAEILERRRMPIDQVLMLVSDLAAVLASAHQHAVVHGGLRPHSIVVITGSRGFPVQVGGWAGLRPTGACPIPAMPDPYDAPELATGTVGPASDVFSLGAIAHLALTGRPPARSTPDLVAGVPGPVGSLVVRMLAFEPGRRPLAAELERSALDLLGADDRVRVAPRPTPRFATPRWTPDTRAEPVELLASRTTTERLVR